MKENPELEFGISRCYSSLFKTNQNGSRVVGEGFSNYSISELEARAKTPREKYNLVLNQLAD